MFNTNQPAYKRLRSIISERTNRLVAWIGSGPSMDAGLPCWNDLKNSLQQNLVEKARAAEPDDQSSLIKFEQQIAATTDYWLSFELLKNSLGQATYRASIRQIFESAVTCKVPSIYSDILDLPITGILNLNLDRLATRAFSQKYPGRALVEFSGGQVGNFMHILKSSTFFIANLHGITEDEGSWVLTKPELNEKLEQQSYKDYINSCLCTRTIVFLGISADDVAVGGHLQRLSNRGVDLGDHFWITNRSDPLTQYWADKTQIQIIHYNSHNEDHSELSELLSGLAQYQSLDDNPPPVEMSKPRYSSGARSPEELCIERSPEALRNYLNSEASIILKSSTADSYEQYEDFTQRYDEAIYRAWYVTTKDPYNKLFGYTLINEVADGAFGRVFKATNSVGKTVAVKLLKEQVRKKKDMLQSFRRGVRSMRILANHNIPGMIPYEEASEIPACAVMEFVEGPNLHEAVQARYCRDWSTVLDISVQLANIIRKAHLLPERVLHRDLRPPNIMLKNYYLEPNQLNVVVLDFDLSWHMGSSEVSIVQSARNGYLAPEQVEKHIPFSTRNAAVDSYGFGMTLYYLRTGIEPLYLQHRHTSWKRDLTEAIMKNTCKSWWSTSRRFARLILNATKDRQPERWDMGQIEGELELLKDAVAMPARVRSAELLAEELAFRIVSSGGYPLYDWNQDNLSASIALASGVRIQIIPKEEDQNVMIYFDWSNKGDRDAKNVKKYLPSAIDAACGKLKSRGWNILKITRMRVSEAFFGLNTRVDRLSTCLDEDAKIIAEVLTRFTF